MAKILIVEARFYDDLADELQKGAVEAIKKAGFDHEIISVPGALEIPGAITLAAESYKYVGFVALGVVIRGETYHFEVVANESARGLMELTLEGVSIGNGILTTENFPQAWERAKVNGMNKGGFAAEAAIRMIELKNNFHSKKGS